MLRTPRTDDGKKLLKQQVLEAMKLMDHSLVSLDWMFQGCQVVLGTPNCNTCDVDGGQEKGVTSSQRLRRTPKKVMGISEVQIHSIWACQGTWGFLVIPSHARGSSHF